MNQTECFEPNRQKGLSFSKTLEIFLFYDIIMLVKSFSIENFSVIQRLSSRENTNERNIHPQL